MLKTINQIEFSLENGKEIIGFYENLLLNNLKGTASISQLCYSILENIHNKKFKHPVLLEIFSNEIVNDGKETVVIKDEPVINVMFKQIKLSTQIYRFSKLTNSSNFDFVGIHSISDNQFKLMASLLKENKQNEIVDFDDHFLDAELDWRNNFVELENNYQRIKLKL